jgi:hypothetical protein
MERRASMAIEMKWPAGNLRRGVRFANGCGVAKVE